MQLRGKMLVQHTHSCGLDSSTAKHSRDTVQPSLSCLTPVPCLRPSRSEGGKWGAGYEKNNGRLLELGGGTLAFPVSTVLLYLALSHPRALRLFQTSDEFSFLGTKPKSFIVGLWTRPRLLFLKLFTSSVDRRFHLEKMVKFLISQVF